MFALSEEGGVVPEGLGAYSSPSTATTWERGSLGARTRKSAVSGTEGADGRAGVGRVLRPRAGRRHWNRGPARRLGLNVADCSGPPPRPLAHQQDRWVAAARPEEGRTLNSWWRGPR